ncbi:MAG: response regulator [Polyangiaceae bacterium]
MLSGRLEHLGRILVVEPEPTAAQAVVSECAKLRRTLLVQSGADARRSLEGRPNFMAVVLEHDLPDGSGLGVLKACRAAYPRVPVLMLTATTSSEVINRSHALRAEFVAKPAHRRNVRAFLQRAVAFERVPDSRVAHVIEDLVQCYQLSPRETDVLAAAIGGIPRRTVADQIGTTENTIKSITRSLLRKCSSENLEDVVRTVWIQALAGSDSEDQARDPDSVPPSQFTIPPPPSGSGQ